MSRTRRAASGICATSVSWRATPRASDDEQARRLSAQGETIIFERELTYVTSGLWFWVLDFLLMRRRMNRESRIALERLKERLERPASRDTAPSCLANLILWEKRWVE